MSQVRNCFNVECDFILRDARLRQGHPMLPIIYLVLFAESFEQRREITKWDNTDHLISWLVLTARCTKPVVKKCLDELVRQKLIALQGGYLTVFGLEVMNPNIKHWYSTVANPKGVSKYKLPTTSSAPPQQVPTTSSAPCSVIENVRRHDSDSDSDSDYREVKDSAAPAYVGNAQKTSSVEQESQDGLSEENSEESQEPYPATPSSITLSVGDTLNEYIREVAKSYRDKRLGYKWRRILIGKAFTFRVPAVGDKIAQVSEEKLLPAIVHAVLSGDGDRAGLLYTYAVKYALQDGDNDTARAIVKKALRA